VTRLSAWFVRTALAWLVAGTLLGALMLAGKGMPALAPSLVWRAAHQELALIGWMLQLVFGVALWILPTPPGEPRDRQAGPGYIAYALLNAGVLAAAVGGLPGGPPALVFAGRVLVAGAAVVVATILLPRMRPYGMMARTDP
jgi:hypothetical protein